MSARWPLPYISRMVAIGAPNDPLTVALRALADPNRRRLIAELRHREECVSALADRLGMSTALASHHLRLLVAAGFVHERRRGSWRCYSLQPNYLEWLRMTLEVLLDPDLGAAASCCANSCGSGG